MRVAKETVVAIEYTLKDDQGNIIDASGERGPMEYLHGAQNIIPGLEQGVEGLVAGDTKNVLVPPQLGYGEYSEKLLQLVPLTAFGANTPQVGMRFHAEAAAAARPKKAPKAVAAPPKNRPPRSRVAAAPAAAVALK